MPAAAIDQEVRLVEMRIDQTDREIDTLVYDLDDLTPDEIAVVEASVGRAKA